MSYTPEMRSLTVMEVQVQEGQGGTRKAGGSRVGISSSSNVSDRSNFSNLSNLSNNNNNNSPSSSSSSTVPISTVATGKSFGAGRNRPQMSLGCRGLQVLLG